jgi:polyferredoxin
LVKRKVIQVAAALLQNAHFKGFLTGSLYKGQLKSVCVPGLNCYSCPGALGACPIGSLQAMAGNPQTLVSFYVYGLILIFGLFFGRLICGFLCPFGLLQELLYKIPLKKIINHRCFQWLKWGKYVVLAIFVIGIPIYLTLANEVSFPAFCQWICPVGTLEAGIPIPLANERVRGGLGLLYAWKMLILILVILSAIKIFRPFCRFLCPLGALYSLTNRISVVHIKTDPTLCDGCGKCEKVCLLGLESPDQAECVRCGKCVSVCPQKAKRWSVRRSRHDTENGNYGRQIR